MRNDWIYRREHSSAAFRLFCFPYAGGSAAVYRGWQEQFPDRIEVCAVEPPGRRHRTPEEPLRRLPDLAAAVVAGLAAEADLPFAFFGHSLGALVAFDVAQRLSGGGHPGPRVLFLSGAAAPHLPRRRRTLWNLPPAELISEVRAYGGTPPDVLDDPAFLEIFLPVIRADFEMFETYTFEADTRLDSPVYLYGGEDDERVSAARLWAWRDVADVVAVEMFSGGHFYLREQYRPLTASIGRVLDGLLSPVGA
ncbi:MAG TPA: alpha/beta fold hydrolase [Streptosporangiaceae bacterium]|jgi:medium-chain acyl-[acyl-carrier-protein] hydrolase